MRKILALFLALAFLSFADYDLCSSCNGEAPKECTGLPVKEVPCSISSASFSCQQIVTTEGWILCPLCPDGYDFARCESSWLFGLYKISYCVQNYGVACGAYCEQSDNVISRSECSINSSKKCCTIPTNEIQLVSPQSGSTHPRNETASFTVNYTGAITNLSIDFGDGSIEWKQPNVNKLTIFEHNYTSTGAFNVSAWAYSCWNCSYKYNSTFSIIINVH